MSKSVFCEIDQISAMSPWAGFFDSVRVDCLAPGIDVICWALGRLDGSRAAQPLTDASRANAPRTLESGLMLGRKTGRDGEDIER
jgi:hypothetical protein